jgi:fatty-acyl-CoA synthase
MGEKPVAFVELREGVSPNPGELIRSFCKEHLAGYKVPSRIFFAELPKSATGKIQKFVLREHARQTPRET